MKTHYPFFDYSWFKLWIFVLVAIQMAEVYSFFERTTTPITPTFAESVYKQNAEWCRKNERWCK